MEPCRDCSKLHWAPPTPFTTGLLGGQRSSGDLPQHVLPGSRAKHRILCENVKPSLGNIIPTLILPIPYFQCSIFFSLRKQLKSIFLAQFCVSFFFSLRTLQCLHCAILPSDAVYEFQRKFPNISDATSFLVLAAALIFCFLHLIAIMPCNEKAVVSPECLRQSQCFLCLNISK